MVLSGSKSQPSHGDREVGLQPLVVREGHPEDAAYSFPGHSIILLQDFLVAGGLHCPQAEQKLGKSEAGTE